MLKCSALLPLIGGRQVPMKRRCVALALPIFALVWACSDSTIPTAAPTFDATNPNAPSKFDIQDSGP